MLPTVCSKRTPLWMASLIVLLLVPLWAPVHAQEATPRALSASPEPIIETLLDTTTDSLPTGHAIVAVDRWTLRPSATALTVPPLARWVLVTVESGSLTATAAGTEHQLAARDTFVFPADQEVALRASGSEDATAFIVYLISGPRKRLAMFASESTDPIAHSVEWLISTSADALPGGSARVVLERMTLPPGSALPPQEASPLVWTEVGAGAVRLMLEGEQLPFRWKSGAERTFQQGQYLPALQPGTQMTLRNGGDDPLVLYRLTLMPDSERSSGGTAIAGTPSS